MNIVPIRTKPLASTALKLATSSDREVYLNFYFDPPGSVPRVVAFTGPSAHDEALEDARDAWGEDVPQAGYLTTLVLEPSGLWTEKYLFGL